VVEPNIDLRGLLSREIFIFFEKQIEKENSFKK
jgi:hypothetical protein